MRIVATNELLRVGIDKASSLEEELTSGEQDLVLKALRMLGTPDAAPAISEQRPKLALTIMESCLKSPALVEPALAVLRRLPPQLLASYMGPIANRLDKPVLRQKVISLVQTLPPDYSIVVAACLDPQRPEWLQRAALTTLPSFPKDVLLQQVSFHASPPPLWRFQRRGTLIARV